MLHCYFEMWLANSYFLLKTHHKSPCNDACVFFSLEPKLQCVTSQLRAVFVQQKTKNGLTRVTRQGMGLIVTSARDLGCVLSASHHLGAGLSHPGSTQAATSLHAVVHSAIVPKPNACFTARWAQQFDNSVIVHNLTA